jgi:hypothetical protein
MLVPGAFGSHVNHYPNGTYICDNNCYDQMCAQDAHDFYTWAKADDRVVAIMPVRTPPSALWLYSNAEPDLLLNLRHAVELEGLCRVQRQQMDAATHMLYG